MNEIQILTTYNPFVVTGTVLTALWAVAYILSWVIQWVWAWVDEGEVGRSNWVANKLSHKSRGWVRTDDYWRYRKFLFGIFQINCQDNISCVEVGESAIILKNGNRFVMTYPVYPLLIWFGVLCLIFWNISMWFAMVYALALTARMVRRGQKMLKAHMEDKNAHKA